MSILILTAVTEELKKERAPAGAEVIYTGVGKVNAAWATTHAITTLKPKLVINYGTAGKIHKMHNGVVEVAHVVQRDMMAMPLAPRGRTPFSDGIDRLSSGHGTVTCGTGDSFVTSADPWLVDNAIEIVDMELYAIAYVCERQNVPWRSFKFITDEADDNAANNWQDNIADGEEMFWSLLKSLTQKLAQ